MHNFQVAKSEDIYLGSFTVQKKGSYLDRKGNKCISPAVSNIDRADISLFYLFKPEWRDLVGSM